MTYKEEHEKFMSGHQGTTFEETLFVTAIPMVALWSRDILTVIVQKSLNENFNQKSSNLCFGLTFFLDFVLLVLPNILSVTILSDFIVHLFIGAVVAGILLYILCHRFYLSKSSKSNIEDVNLSEQKTFVTYFRSVMLLCTAIGILAVDFPVYPRRLAKAETYGFGGMDIGVGFYIVTNAIISPEARGKKNILSFDNSIKKSIKSSIPLVILGCARLAAVKGVEYQEHVTEYGVHWNFFFTLAALKIICPAVVYFIKPSQAGPLAVLVLVLHQFFLSVCGASDYIVNGRDGRGGREGLLDANREGILSLPGSLSIYLFGVHIGLFIFSKRKNLKDWLWAAGTFFIAAVLFATLTGVTHQLVQPVSRRFANSAYVFWIICLSLNMILGGLIGEIAVTLTKARLHSTSRQKDETDPVPQPVTQPSVTPRITRSKTKEANISHKQMDSNPPVEKQQQKWLTLTEAVTFNSLLFFLLANVMTGLVNLTVPTLHTTPQVAVSILMGYMCTLTFVIYLLRIQNISTKFW